MHLFCQEINEANDKRNNARGRLPRTRLTAEVVSAPSFVHPDPRVGPMGRRVEPGHAELVRAATDRQVFVLSADGAAELLVVALLPQTAAWKRRWEKNDER